MELSPNFGDGLKDQAAAWSTRESRGAVSSLVPIPRLTVSFGHGLALVRVEVNDR
jgi:hypothetical protein